MSSNSNTNPTGSDYNPPPECFTSDQMDVRMAILLLNLDVNVAQTNGYSHQDIKRAYRKVSLLVHPDKSPDPNATQKFQRVNSANTFLLQQPDPVRIYPPKSNSYQSMFSKIPGMAQFFQSATARRSNGSAEAQTKAREDYAQRLHELHQLAMERRRKKEEEMRRKQEEQRRKEEELRLQRERELQEAQRRQQEHDQQLQALLRHNVQAYIRMVQTEFIEAICAQCEAHPLPLSASTLKTGQFLRLMKPTLLALQTHLHAPVKRLHFQTLSAINQYVEQMMAIVNTMLQQVADKNKDLKSQRKQQQTQWGMDPPMSSSGRHHGGGADDGGSDGDDDDDDDLVVLSDDIVTLGTTGPPRNTTTSNTSNSDIISSSSQQQQQEQQTPSNRTPLTPSFLSRLFMAYSTSLSSIVSQCDILFGFVPIIDDYINTRGEYEQLHGSLASLSSVHQYQSNRDTSHLFNDLPFKLSPGLLMRMHNIGLPQWKCVLHLLMVECYARQEVYSSFLAKTWRNIMVSLTTVFGYCYDKCRALFPPTLEEIRASFHISATNSLEQQQQQQQRQQQQQQQDQQHDQQRTTTTTPAPPAHHIQHPHTFQQYIYTQSMTTLLTHTVTSLMLVLQTTIRMTIARLSSKTLSSLQFYHQDMIGQTIPFSSIYPTSFHQWNTMRRLSRATPPGVNPSTEPFACDPLKDNPLQSQLFPTLHMIISQCDSAILNLYTTGSFSLIESFFQCEQHPQAASWYTPIALVQSSHTPLGHPEEDITQSSLAKEGPIEIDGESPTEQGTTKSDADGGHGKNTGAASTYFPFEDNIRKSYSTLLSIVSEADDRASPLTISTPQSQNASIPSTGLRLPLESIPTMHSNTTTTGISPPTHSNSSSNSNLTIGSLYASLSPMALYYLNETSIETRRLAKQHAPTRPIQPCFARLLSILVMALSEHPEIKFSPTKQVLTSLQLSTALDTLLPTQLSTSLDHPCSNSQSRVIDTVKACIIDHYFFHVYNHSTSTDPTTPSSSQSSPSPSSPLSHFHTPLFNSFTIAQCDDPCCHCRYDLRTISNIYIDAVPGSNTPSIGSTAPPPSGTSPSSPHVQSTEGSAPSTPLQWLLSFNSISPFFSQLLQGPSSTTHRSAPLSPLAMYDYVDINAQSPVFNPPNTLHPLIAQLLHLYRRSVLHQFSFALECGDVLQSLAATPVPASSLLTPSPSSSASTFTSTTSRTSTTTQATILNLSGDDPHLHSLLTYHSLVSLSGLPYTYHPPTTDNHTHRGQHRGRSTPSIPHLIFHQHQIISNILSMVSQLDLASCIHHIKMLPQLPPNDDLHPSRLALAAAKAGKNRPDAAQAASPSSSTGSNDPIPSNYRFSNQVLRCIEQLLTTAIVEPYQVAMEMISMYQAFSLDSIRSPLRTTSSSARCDGRRGGGRRANTTTAHPSPSLLDEDQDSRQLSAYLINNIFAIPSLLPNSLKHCAITVSSMTRQQRASFLALQRHGSSSGDCSAYGVHNHMTSSPRAREHKHSGVSNLALPIETLLALQQMAQPHIQTLNKCVDGATNMDTDTHMDMHDDPSPHRHTPSPLYTLPFLSDGPRGFHSPQTLGQQCTQYGYLSLIQQHHTVHHLHTAVKMVGATGIPATASLTTPLFSHLTPPLLQPSDIPLTACSQFDWHLYLSTILHASLDMLGDSGCGGSSDLDDNDSYDDENMHDVPVLSPHPITRALNALTLKLTLEITSLLISSAQQHTNPSYEAMNFPTVFTSSSPASTQHSGASSSSSSSQSVSDADTATNPYLHLSFSVRVQQVLFSKIQSLGVFLLHTLEANVREHLPRIIYAMSEAEAGAVTSAPSDSTPLLSMRKPQTSHTQTSPQHSTYSIIHRLHTMTSSDSLSPRLPMTAMTATTSSTTDTMTMAMGDGGDDECDEHQPTPHTLSSHLFPLWWHASSIKPQLLLLLLFPFFPSSQLTRSDLPLTVSSIASAVSSPDISAFFAFGGDSVIQRDDDGGVSPGVSEHHPPPPPYPHPGATSSHCDSYEHQYLQQLLYYCKPDSVGSLTDHSVGDGGGNGSDCNDRTHGSTTPSQTQTSMSPSVRIIADTVCVRIPTSLVASPLPYHMHHRHPHPGLSHSHCLPAIESQRYATYIPMHVLEHVLKSSIPPAPSQQPPQQEERTHGSNPSTLTPTTPSTAETLHAFFVFCQQLSSHETLQKYFAGLLSAHPSSNSLRTPYTPFSPPIYALPSLFQPSLCLLCPPCASAKQHTIKPPPSHRTPSVSGSGSGTSPHTPSPIDILPPRANSITDHLHKLTMHDGVNITQLFNHLSQFTHDVHQLRSFIHTHPHLESVITTWMKDTMLPDILLRRFHPHHEYLSNTTIVHPTTTIPATTTQSDAFTVRALTFNRQLPVISKELSIGINSKASYHDDGSFLDYHVAHLYHPGCQLIRNSPNTYYFSNHNFTVDRNCGHIINSLYTLTSSSPASLATTPTLHSNMVKNQEFLIPVIPPSIGVLSLSLRRFFGLIDPSDVVVSTKTPTQTPPTTVYGGLQYGKTSVNPLYWCIEQCQSSILANGTRHTRQEPLSKRFERVIGHSHPPSTHDGTSHCVHATSATSTNWTYHCAKPFSYPFLAPPPPPPLHSRAAENNSSPYTMTKSGMVRDHEDTTLDGITQPRSGHRHLDLHTQHATTLLAFSTGIVLVYSAYHAMHTHYFHLHADHQYACPPPSSSSPSPETPQRTTPVSSAKASGYYRNNSRAYASLFDQSDVLLSMAMSYLPELSTHITPASTPFHHSTSPLESLMNPAPTVLAKVLDGKQLSLSSQPPAMPACLVQIKRLSASLACTLAIFYSSLVKHTRQASISNTPLHQPSPSLLGFYMQRDSANASQAAAYMISRSSCKWNTFETYLLRFVEANQREGGSKPGMVGSSPSPSPSSLPPTHAPVSAPPQHPIAFTLTDISRFPINDIAASTMSPIISQLYSTCLRLEHPLPNTLPPSSSQSNLPQQPMATASAPSTATNTHDHTTYQIQQANQLVSAQRMQQLSLPTTVGVTVQQLSSGARAPTLVHPLSYLRSHRVSNLTASSSSSSARGDHRQSGSVPTHHGEHSHTAAYPPDTATDPYMECILPGDSNEYITSHRYYEQQQLLTQFNLYTISAQVLMQACSPHNATNPTSIPFEPRTVDVLKRRQRKLITQRNQPVMMVFDASDDSDGDGHGGSPDIVIEVPSGDDDCEDNTDGVIPATHQPKDDSAMSPSHTSPYIPASLPDSVCTMVKQHQRRPHHAVSASPFLTSSGTFSQITAIDIHRTSFGVHHHHHNSFAISDLLTFVSYHHWHPLPLVWHQSREVYLDNPIHHQPHVGTPRVLKHLSPSSPGPYAHHQSTLFPSHLISPYSTLHPTQHAIVTCSVAHHVYTGPFYSRDIPDDTPMAWFDTHSKRRATHETPTIPRVLDPSIKPSYNHPLTSGEYATILKPVVVEKSELIKVSQSTTAGGNASGGNAGSGNAGGTTTAKDKLHVRVDPPAMPEVFDTATSVRAGQFTSLIAAFVLTACGTIILSMMPPHAHENKNMETPPDGEYIDDESMTAPIHSHPQPSPLVRTISHTAMLIQVSQAFDITEAFMLIQLLTNNNNMDYLVSRTYSKDLPSPFLSHHLHFVLVWAKLVVWVAQSQLLNPKGKGCDTYRLEHDTSICSVIQSHPLLEDNPHLNDPHFSSNTLLPLKYHDFIFPSSSSSSSLSSPSGDCPSFDDTGGASPMHTATPQPPYDCPNPPTTPASLTWVMPQVYFPTMYVHLITNGRLSTAADRGTVSFDAIPLFANITHTHAYARYSSLYPDALCHLTAVLPATGLFDILTDHFTNIFTNRLPGTCGPHDDPGDKDSDDNRADDLQQQQQHHQQQQRHYLVDSIARCYLSTMPMNNPLLQSIGSHHMRAMVAWADIQQTNLHGSSPSRALGVMYDHHPSSSQITSSAHASPNAPSSLSKTPLHMPPQTPLSIPPSSYHAYHLAQATSWHIPSDLSLHLIQYGERLAPFTMLPRMLYTPHVPPSLSKALMSTQEVSIEQKPDALQLVAEYRADLSRHLLDLSSCLLSTSQLSMYCCSIMAHFARWLHQYPGGDALRPDGMPPRTYSFLTALRDIASFLLFLSAEPLAPHRFSRPSSPHPGPSDAPISLHLLHGIHTTTSHPQTYLNLKARAHLSSRLFLPGILQLTHATSHTMAPPSTVSLSSLSTITRFLLEYISTSSPISSNKVSQATSHAISLAVVDTLRILFVAHRIALFAHYDLPSPHSYTRYLHMYLPLLQAWSSPSSNTPIYTPRPSLTHPHSPHGEQQQRAPASTHATPENTTFTFPSPSALQCVDSGTALFPVVDQALVDLHQYLQDTPMVMVANTHALHPSTQPSSPSQITSSPQQHPLHLYAIPPLQVHQLHGNSPTLPLPISTTYSHVDDLSDRSAIIHDSVNNTDTPSALTDHHRIKLIQHHYCIAYDSVVNLVPFYDSNTSPSSPYLSAFYKANAPTQHASHTHAFRHSYLAVNAIMSPLAAPPPLRSPSDHHISRSPFPPVLLSESTRLLDPHELAVKQFLSLSITLQHACNMMPGASVVHTLFTPLLTSPHNQYSRVMADGNPWALPFCMPRSHPDSAYGDADVNHNTGGEPDTKADMGDVVVKHSLMLVQSLRGWAMLWEPNQNRPMSLVASRQSKTFTPTTLSMTLLVYLSYFYTHYYPYNSIPSPTLQSLSLSSPSALPSSSPLPSFPSAPSPLLSSPSAIHDLCLVVIHTNQLLATYGAFPTSIRDPSVKPCLSLLRYLRYQFPSYDRISDAVAPSNSQHYPSLTLPPPAVDVALPAIPKTCFPASTNGLHDNSDEDSDECNAFNNITSLSVNRHAAAQRSFFPNTSSLKPPSRLNTIPSSSSSSLASTSSTSGSSQPLPSYHASLPPPQSIQQVIQSSTGATGPTSAVNAANPSASRAGFPPTTLLTPEIPSTIMDFPVDLPSTGKDTPLAPPHANIVKYILDQLFIPIYMTSREPLSLPTLADHLMRFHHLQMMQITLLLQLYHHSTALSHHSVPFSLQVSQSQHLLGIPPLQQHQPPSTPQQLLPCHVYNHQPRVPSLPSLKQSLQRQQQQHQQQRQQHSPSHTLCLLYNTTSDLVLQRVHHARLIAQTQTLRSQTTSLISSYNNTQHSTTNPTHAGDGISTREVMGLIFYSLLLSHLANHCVYTILDNKALYHRFISKDPLQSSAKKARHHTRLLSIHTTTTLPFTQRVLYGLYTSIHHPTDYQLYFRLINALTFDLRVLKLSGHSMLLLFRRPSEKKETMAGRHQSLLWLCDSDGDSDSDGDGDGEDCSDTGNNDAGGDSEKDKERTETSGFLDTILKPLLATAADDGLLSDLVTPPTSLSSSPSTTSASGSVDSTSSDHANTHQDIPDSSNHHNTDVSAQENAQPEPSTAPRTIPGNNTQKTRPSTTTADVNYHRPRQTTRANQFDDLRATAEPSSSSIVGMLQQNQAPHSTQPSLSLSSSLSSSSSLARSTSSFKPPGGGRGAFGGLSGISAFPPSTLTRQKGFNPIAIGIPTPQQQQQHQQQQHAHGVRTTTSSSSSSSSIPASASGNFSLHNSSLTSKLLSRTLPTIKTSRGNIDGSGPTTVAKPSSTTKNTASTPPPTPLPSSFKLKCSRLLRDYIQHQSAKLTSNNKDDHGNTPTNNYKNNHNDNNRKSDIHKNNDQPPHYARLSRSQSLQMCYSMIAATTANFMASLFTSAAPVPTQYPAFLQPGLFTVPAYPSTKSSPQQSQTQTQSQSQSQSQPHPQDLHNQGNQVDLSSIASGANFLTKSYSTQALERLVTLCNQVDSMLAQYHHCDPGSHKATNLEQKIRNAHEEMVTIQMGVEPHHGIVLTELNAKYNTLSSLLAPPVPSPLHGRRASPLLSIMARQYSLAGDVTNASMHTESQLQSQPYPLPPPLLPVIPLQSITLLPVTMCRHKNCTSQACSLGWSVWFQSLSTIRDTIYAFTLPFNYQLVHQHWLSFIDRIGVVVGITQSNNRLLGFQTRLAKPDLSLSSSLRNLILTGYILNFYPAIAPPPAQVISQIIGRHPPSPQQQVGKPVLPPPCSWEMPPGTTVFSMATSRLEYLTSIAKIYWKYQPFFSYHLSHPGGAPRASYDGKRSKPRKPQRTALYDSILQELEPILNYKPQSSFYSTDNAQQLYYVRVLLHYYLLGAQWLRVYDPVRARGSDTPHASPSHSPAVPSKGMTFSTLSWLFPSLFQLLRIPGQPPLSHVISPSLATSPTWMPSIIGDHDAVLSSLMRQFTHSLPPSAKATTSAYDQIMMDDDDDDDDGVAVIIDDHLSGSDSGSGSGSGAHHHHSDNDNITIDDSNSSGDDQDGDHETILYLDDSDSDHDSDSNTATDYPPIDHRGININIPLPTLFSQSSLRSIPSNDRNIYIIPSSDVTSSASPPSPSSLSSSPPSSTSSTSPHPPSLSPLDDSPVTVNISNPLRLQSFTKHGKRPRAAPERVDLCSSDDSDDGVEVRFSSHDADSRRGGRRDDDNDIDIDVDVDEHDSNNDDIDITFDSSRDHDMRPPKKRYVPLPSNQPIQRQHEARNVGATPVTPVEVDDSDPFADTDSDDDIVILGGNTF